MPDRGNMRTQIFPTRRLASHGVRSTVILNLQAALLGIGKVMGRIGSRPVTVGRKCSDTKHVSPVQRHILKPLANGYRQDHTVFVVKDIYHP